MRTHSCGELTSADISKTVKLCGWVDAIRDHGNIIFVDLRDSKGIVQVVFTSEDKGLLLQAKQLRGEWVIMVEGQVKRRPKGSENPNITTGEIEVIVDKLNVLNRAKTLPLQPDASEELRLCYRYIDIRKGHLKDTLKTRHRLLRLIRNYLDERDFIEVETPMLIKPTPEGARDFLIPSRMHPGKFYALPQSPQLFKQILMVAGLERYYQIARCFRDEDLRADRQPEFTQLDIELSFVNEEDIINLIEDLLYVIFKEILDVELKLPFCRLSLTDSMNFYGTATPDLRFDFKLIDITDIFRESHFRVFRQIIDKNGVVKALHVPKHNPTNSQLEEYKAVAILHGGGGLVHFKRHNSTIDSPIKKYLSESELLAVSNLLSGDDSVLLVVSGELKVVNEALGSLRSYIAKKIRLINEAEFKPVWIVDHYLFERDKDGEIAPTHHPFTSPIPQHQYLLYTSPLDVKARAYDLIINGTEVGGGSIRVHNADMQRRIFDILGIDKKTQEERFGFLIEALEYGAPPHGGIALGIDRLLKIMLKYPSIREVIAFPKTQSGLCLLSNAPFEVSLSQLKELHLIKEEYPFEPHLYQN